MASAAVVMGERPLKGTAGQHGREQRGPPGRVAKSDVSQASLLPRAGSAVDAALDAWSDFPELMAAVAMAGGGCATATNAPPTGARGLFQERRHNEIGCFRLCIPAYQY